MSIPPEAAWLIPIIVPFIIGFLIGALVKKAFKMTLIVLALVIVLISTGALSLTFTDLYDRAMEFLPRLSDTASGWVNILPYSSIMFIIGLVLALWKVRS